MVQLWSFLTQSHWHIAVSGWKRSDSAYTLERLVGVCLDRRWSGCPVPQQAAGRGDVILQLEHRASADGHTAVVLDLRRVQNIVRPGHHAAVINLQTPQTKDSAFRRVQHLPDPSDLYTAVRRRTFRAKRHLTARSDSGSFVQDHQTDLCLFYFLSPWFCSEDLHPDQSGFLRTPQEAAPGRYASVTLPASYLFTKTCRNVTYDSGYLPEVRDFYKSCLTSQNNDLPSCFLTQEVFDEVVGHRKDLWSCHKNRITMRFQMKPQ